MANEWVDVGMLKRWGDPSTATGNTIFGASASGNIGKDLTGGFHQYQRYEKWSNSVTTPNTDRTTHTALEDGIMKFGRSYRYVTGETPAKNTYYNYTYWVMTDGYDVFRIKDATILECNVIQLSASGYSTSSPTARLTISTENNTYSSISTKYNAITTTGLFRGALEDSGENSIVHVENPDAFTHIVIKAAISAGSSNGNNYSTTLKISNLRFLKS